MKGIMALAIVVLVLALVGWVTFGITSDEASINLEVDSIREDAESAVINIENALSPDDAPTPIDSSGTSD